MENRLNGKQLGYTCESLRMLESEEGQTNAIFACFGSAVQHSQLFEQGLDRFLIIYNKITSDSVSIDDIGQQMTMGQLLHRVREHVTFDDKAIEEQFSAVVKERNYLIHRFFLERDPQFKSTEGRFQLLSQLQETEENLDTCRVMINAMRIAMCRSLGIKDDWAHEYS